MSWDNLQLDILVEFADPRWAGLHLSEAQLPNGTAAISENDNWKVTARKKDATFTERVLELIAGTCSWNSTVLAAAAGDPTRRGATTVGVVLSNAPGWRQIRCSAARLWVNDANVVAHVTGRTDVFLEELSAETGLGRMFIGNALRAAGWTSVERRYRKGRRAQCWNPPEVSTD